MLKISSYYMRKTCYLYLLLPLFSFTGDRGIRFQHDLTWKEIQMKAQAENKYIFVDCYTSWCAPCRFMSTNIFPLAAVGDYMNSKFISIKVQMDSTGKDSEEVKCWYADARQLMRQYNVGIFPTYLFFSPDGKLVHRASGASRDPNEFLSKAADALAADK